MSVITQIREDLRRMAWNNVDISTQYIWVTPDCEHEIKCILNATPPPVAGEPPHEPFYGVPLYLSNEKDIHMYTIRDYPPESAIALNPARAAEEGEG